MTFASAFCVFRCFSQVVLLSMSNYVQPVFRGVQKVQKSLSPCVWGSGGPWRPVLAEVARRQAGTVTWVSIAARVAETNLHVDPAVAAAPQRPDPNHVWHCHPQRPPLCRGPGVAGLMPFSVSQEHQGWRQRKRARSGGLPAKGWRCSVHCSFVLYSEGRTTVVPCRLPRLLRAAVGSKTCRTPSKMGGTVNLLLVLLLHSKVVVLQSASQVRSFWGFLLVLGSMSSRSPLRPLCFVGARCARGRAAPCPHSMVSRVTALGHARTLALDESQ